MFCFWPHECQSEVNLGPPHICWLHEVPVNLSIYSNNSLVIIFAYTAMRNCNWQKFWIREDYFDLHQWLCYLVVLGFKYSIGLNSNHKGKDPVNDYLPTKENVWIGILGWKPSMHKSIVSIWKPPSGDLFWYTITSSS